MSFRAGLAGLVALSVGSLALACWSRPPRLTTDTPDLPMGTEPDLEPKPVVAQAVEQLETDSTPSPDLEAARQAVRDSLPYLEREGIAWFEGRVVFQNGDGCVSCHKVGWALWSHREADRVGLGSGSLGITDLGERATEFLLRPGIGRPVTWSQAILGRHGSAANPADPAAWLEAADLIAASQESGGFWRARGQYPSQRRPIQEGDAAATMWALVSLSAMADLNDTVAASRDRAIEWLQSQEGDTSEWVAGRLVIEHEFGTPELAQIFLKRLLESQRPDGGWGWLPGEDSNAFSTGQALYALARLGSATDMTTGGLQRAVSFLVDTQSDEGTWTVPGELISKGGSDAKDYVYTFWGTAWATIGISRALGSELLGVS